MEPIAILLIVGAISLVNFIVGKMKGGGDGQVLDGGGQPGTDRGTPRPRSAAKTESEAERMRRFMEALGIPQEAAPPPPQPAPRREVPPSPQRAPRREAPPPRPEPAARNPAPEPVRERRYIANPPALPVAVAVAAGVIPATKVEVGLSEIGNVAAAKQAAEAYLIQPATGPESLAKGGIHDLLRNPASVRAALVLREVLGPPRGLQSGIEAHSFP